MGKVSSASVVLSALALLTLAGCTSATPEPTASPSRSSAASPTASPEPSPTATSTPSDAEAQPSSAPVPPSPSPAPGQGGGTGDGTSSGTPLDARSAYLACRSGAWQAAASTPEQLSWAPVEDSYVVQVGDAWRVYIEYVRTAGSAGGTFEGAASCVFRGTVESPVAERVGAGLRDDPTSEPYWTPLSE